MSSISNSLSASSDATADGGAAASAGASTSASAASSALNEAYSPVKFMDARGATIDFLGEALQLEQTHDFKSETPKFLKGLQYEALKRKGGKLRKRESGYVGFLYAATMAKLLKSGWVFAEHRYEEKKEHRRLFSGSLPLMGAKEQLRRQWKKQDWCVLWMADGSEVVTSSTPMIVVVTSPHNRCDIKEVKWNNIHFTAESKSAFEGTPCSGGAGPAAAANSDRKTWSTKRQKSRTQ
jgi:hypothetical protein